MALTFRSPAAVTAGVFAIGLGAAASLWWLLGNDQAVLFDQLDGTQLNALSSELDRAGIAHHIDRERAAITVAEADARSARLALQGAGSTLRETAGFELFDKSEFGMTEFSQKINYQRAVEGEIARTVSALAGIKHTRVHLVLPEQGLFNSGQRKPRASITVFLADGATLPAEHIRGIQRIATSAVPELEESAVTVVNQSGVILSDGGDGRPDSSTRLAQKKTVETYLQDKLRRVLAPAVGEGNFAVSVDVALDLNQRTTTTEKVLGSGANAGVKRLKESSTRDKGESGTDDLLREIEYAVGHQSEQIVHSAGEITRLQVGVIVDSAVAGVDLAKLRELIAATAGIDDKRGDRIAVVQSPLPRPPATAPAPAPIATISAVTDAAVPMPATLPGTPWTLAALFGIGLAAGGLAMRLATRPRARRLDDASLQALRQRLQQWVDADLAEVERP